MLDKNILVTGGAGFIGSHLVRSLLADGGSRVVVVDNFNDFYDPGLKRRNIRPFLDHSNFRVYEADIRDNGQMRDVFAANELGTVVHLAAMAGVRPSLKDPHIYADVNINGTLNLLELAREFDVAQFVFGSSSSVYGSQPDVPFSEDQNVSRPISPYAATKAAGELFCHTYSHLYDVRTICLRFFTVYGACQRPDLAIHKFSRLISEGRPIPVFGDGSSRRDYTYIDDIIHGVRAAMDYDSTPFEIINLGESQTVELRYLVELLERNLGKKAAIDRQPFQPGDVLQTFADISKASRLLNYDPQTGIEDGIRKFVEWFQAARDDEGEKT